LYKFSFYEIPVDIETEWNLKIMTRLCILSLLRVDIETEWNLKDVRKTRNHGNLQCRYRNRVEFKGFQRTLSHP